MVKILLKTKKTLLAMIVVLCMFGFTACAKNKSQNTIEGKWTKVEDSQRSMTFYEDGTCLDIPIKTSADALSYKLQEDGVLILEMEWDGPIVIKPTESPEEAYDSDEYYYLDSDSLIFDTVDYVRGDPNTEAEKDDSTDETTNNGEITDETEATQKTARILMLGNYSEGLAWVWWNEEGNYNQFYGFIDKEGKVQFFIESGEAYNLVIGSQTEFSNGYAHMWPEDAHIVVNTYGDVVSKYVLDKDNSVKAFGDGYVCTEKYSSGFEDTHYTYTIYDPDGKELQEFEYGSEPLNSVGYYGKGVFGFFLENENGGAIQRFYCAASDRWVDSAIANDYYNIYFYDDIAVVGIDYSSESGYRAMLQLMDINGNLTEIPLSGDFGWNWSEAFVSEGYCILEELDGYLVTYNLSTKEFKKMDNEYVDNLQIDRLPDRLIFQNGMIALPLEGSDEEDYVAVFD